LDVKQYLSEFGLDALVEYKPFPEEGINEAVDPTRIEPYGAEWDDLVRLHDLVLRRRVTTILELGCGFSTLFLAHALALNAQRHGDFVRRNLRRNNPFELHCVDDMPEYLEISQRRIPAHLATFVHPHQTRVRMCSFNGRVATEYERLPNICPDFIYLDAPSQHSVIGDINGISTAHPDRLPMACDLLKIEHFLLPGTLILVDGRTANARFLKTNFQRDWAYHYDRDADVHYFELQEEPLGKYNRRQIDYCLDGKFML
jgi:hypothetical protein